MDGPGLGTTDDDDGAGVRVLHVDDEPGFAGMAAQHLERASDRLAVETATGAGEALVQLEQQPFDCVVSDYEMPGMDGLEFLAEVRADHPDLPFVLFTGKGSEEIASRAISEGVTDYLQKGGGTDQYEVLANRVENLARQYRSEHALESSRRRLSLFVDRSPLGVLEWTPEFEVAAVNPAAEEILGYEETDLRGASWEVLVPESEHEQVGSVLEQLAADEGGYRTVNENVTADGERIICEWHTRAITDDGEMVAAFSQFHDVTEREENKRRLETLVSNLPGMVYRCRNEPEWPMEFVDGECEAMTGYPAAALEAGEVVWGEDLLHPEDRERAWRDVQGAVDAGEPFELEYRIVDADGEVRWMWERGRAVHGGNGDLEALEGFITDVTDRVERAGELSETNTVLTTLLSNLPVGVLVEARDREVLAVNEALPSVLGLPLDAEDLRGEDCAAALREARDVFADPAAVIERTGDLLEARERVDGETVALDDGRVVERSHVPCSLPDRDASLWLYREITDGE